MRAWLGHMLAAVADRFAGWIAWTRGVSMLPPDLSPAPAPSAPASPEPAVPRKPRRARVAREPLHISEILNILPRCREMTMVLRKMDANAFRFWREFGAKITVADKIPWQVPATPGELPACGMVFKYEADWEEKDYFPGSFIYFQKLKKNPYYCVVPAGTVTTYVITVAYTDHDGEGLAYEYYAALNAGGNVTIVSQRNMERQRLPRGGSLCRMRWGYPAWLEYHFRENKRHQPEAGQFQNVAAFGEWMFRCAMREYCSGFDDFQVRAERDGVSVAFNVALGRTPDFFKDRDTGLASDGKRKRIFHAVTAHTRTLATGHESGVPAHYRGERSFLWNGEHITITPAERTFARTFKAEAEMVDADAKVPQGVEISKHAAYFRTLTERDWRKGHVKSIGAPPWRTHDQRSVH